MREHYDVDGDNRAAIEFGLEKTAGVITGAAAIMVAVFVSFAAAPIATVSQMGVGLTVAILLDATVVRIVLLPALMLLLGDRVWHVPRLLDRILPRRRVLSTGGRGRGIDPETQEELEPDATGRSKAGPLERPSRPARAGGGRLALGAGTGAAAAEAPTRDEYVQQLEASASPTRKRRSGR